MKLILLKEYIKFQDKTVVGKIFRGIGKLLFGKLTYLTGVDTTGKEFFKTTTSRNVDSLWKKLSEEGYKNLNDTDNFESAKNNYYELRKTRRRS